MEEKKVKIKFKLRIIINNFMSYGLKEDILNRLKVYKELKEKIEDPFLITKFEISNSVEEIIKNQEKFFNRKVKVAGRILTIRRHGNLIFYDLYSNGYKIQLAVSKDKTKNFEYAKEYIQRGDIVGCEGNVGKTIKGELTIFCEEIKILAKALFTLPDKWFGLEDIEERYRKRHIDVILNENVRRNFEIKVKVIQAFRNYLINRGYLDFSTEIPLIQPIYGGAYAKPFITYVNDLKENWFLSISPEIYLKMLIISGFDKVFAITKNFRNESIDVTHNPEFTGFEWYEAYADRESKLKEIEEMIYLAAKEILGKTTIKRKIGNKEYEIDLKPPWKREKMVDLIAQYAGIDVESASDEKIKEFLEKNNIQLKVKEYNRGLAIEEIFETFVEKNLIEPIFVLDYPIETTPLCKPLKDNPDFVERAEGYIFGMEISNVYSELNNPIIQNKLFYEQAKMRELGFEEAHEYDKIFVEAMMVGMPPTGGAGLGIERVLMILLELYSIKEIIYWPMLKRKNESEAVDILTKETI
ncbi:MAG: lysine--tRNA ligase [Candidatus Aenigmarchaeota archaeon]|nr:lysine--tRNA ligase [Candidatus Aenigmarchaeota archaeon]